MFVRKSFLPSFPFRDYKMERERKISKITKCERSERWKMKWNGKLNGEVHEEVKMQARRRLISVCHFTSQGKIKKGEKENKSIT